MFYPITVSNKHISHVKTPVSYRENKFYWLVFLSRKLYEIKRCDNLLMTFGTHTMNWFSTD